MTLPRYCRYIAAVRPRRSITLAGRSFGQRLRREKVIGAESVSFGLALVDGAGVVDEPGATGATGAEPPKMVSKMPSEAAPVDALLAAVDPCFAPPTSALRFAASTTSSTMVDRRVGGAGATGREAVVGGAVAADDADTAVAVG